MRKKLTWVINSFSTYSYVTLTERQKASGATVHKLHHVVTYTASDFPNNGLKSRFQVISIHRGYEEDMQISRMMVSTVYGVELPTEPKDLYWELALPILRIISLSLCA